MCSMVALQGGERQNVMRVGRKGKSGLDMEACPYLLIVPTNLHCHPYHLRAHTVTERLT